MTFSRRFLLFDDHVCVGIFAANSANEASSKPRRLELVLSRSGDFVLVSRYGAEKEQHMTRFVPSSVADEVKELLLFRNRHTEKPFLCERFHGGVDDLDVSNRLLADPFRGYESASDASVGEMSSASIIFDADMSRVGNDEEGNMPIFSLPDQKAGLYSN